MSVPSYDLSVWKIISGDFSSHDSRDFPHFISCYLRSCCDFGWIRCYQIVVIAIKDWLLIFTLPCSGVQITVFNDNFRVWFPFTWCELYISVGQVWIGAASFDEALASYCCQFCVLNIYCSVTPFQNYKVQSTENPQKEFCFRGDLLLAVRCKRNLFAWFLGHWFFIILRFVIDIRLHGILADILDIHPLLFKILGNLWVWRRSFL